VALEKLGVLLKTADTNELEKAMTALFERFGGMGIADLQRVDQRELEQFASHFGSTIRDLPFQLPESFLLLIRTVSLISGVTSGLNKDFNMWDAVDPFARTVLRSGGIDAVRDAGRQALGLVTTVARLPKRLDDLVDRLDRGEVGVRTPDIERRLRSLERTVSRLISALVFAVLLIAGVLLRDNDVVLSWVLIAVSAIPLIHVIATARRR
jgi:predicted unusual protein kinase regulating ubiquinone biosynthesis (AarF/ABC1/UbiB family)